MCQFTHTFAQTNECTVKDADLPISSYIVLPWHTGYQKSSEEKHQSATAGKGLTDEVNDMDHGWSIMFWGIPVDVLRPIKPSETRFRTKWTSPCREHKRSIEFRGRVYTWAFGQTVCVKWHWHEFQDPGFPKQSSAGIATNCFLWLCKSQCDVGLLHTDYTVVRGFTFKRNCLDVDSDLLRTAQWQHLNQNSDYICGFKIRLHMTDYYPKA